MSNPSFTFSNTDLLAYGRKHQYAQLMFCGAGDDYAAARCLCLNRLMFSGFPLFSQSIEKVLKAITFLETGLPTTLKRQDKHNPYLLKQELQTTANYGLNEYDDVLKALYGHFQQRYFDNKDPSKSMSGDELEAFDRLWVHLFEKTPFPTDVKYRLKFPAMLFEQSVLRWMPQYRAWVVRDNKALAPKLSEMEATYLAVERHYSSQAIDRQGHS